MKIDGIELAERIERWQKVLSPLGIGHFRIESVDIADETPSHCGANATARLYRHYDSVQFWFTHDFLDDCTEQRLDEVIIHEWLHVAWRDYEDVTDRAGEAWMSPQAAKDFSESLEHEQEGLIERHARLIYALHNGS